jgi:hypothetical protein
MRGSSDKFKRLRHFATKEVAAYDSPADCAPALMGPHVGGGVGRLHCSGARPAEAPGAVRFPKSNAGQSNAEQWSPANVRGRSVRRGSLLALQWRAHPASADGYRSRVRGASVHPRFC